MVPERDEVTFSSEDAPNVLIPCTLSATLYELIPNIRSVLKNNQRSIKLFETFTLVAKYAPGWLATGNRFSELMAPSIR